MFLPLHLVHAATAAACGMCPGCGVWIGLTAGPGSLGVDGTLVVCGQQG